MGARISRILLVLSSCLEKDNALRIITPITTIDQDGRPDPVKVEIDTEMDRNTEMDRGVEMNRNNEMDRGTETDHSVEMNCDAEMDRGIPPMGCIAPAPKVDQADYTIEMDPLIAAGFHNLTRSPLCRLPEELLLDIMERLDLVTIQCLRRASRLFLRLYSSSVFSNTHDMKPAELGIATFENWSEPEKDLSDNPWQQELKTLLGKDTLPYCQDCHERRRDNLIWTRKYNALTSDYLYCSGCHTEHPVCLFSKTQRSRCSRTRVCIGRQGFIRVCEHLAITWDDVIMTAKSISGLDTDLAKVFLETCNHESHFPKHHRKHTPLVNNQNIYPDIRVLGNIDNGARLVIKWHGHLRLPKLRFDHKGYNKIATPSLIRQKLEEFRRNTPAKYLLPEVSPGHLIEMQTFDPNRCSCLRYAGIEQLPKGWQLTRRDSRTACRDDPSNGLGPLRLYRPENLLHYNDKKRVENHVVGVDATETWDYGSSRTWVITEPCPADRRCLQIAYHHTVTIIPEIRPSPDVIPWGWYQSLDPDSYDLTEDDETYGVLWCRQPGCKNYYRYTRKAPFPLETVNRECTAPWLRE